jgi:hypothetical protein
LFQVGSLSHQSSSSSLSSYKKPEPNEPSEDYPKLELAPSREAAKEQSDAHLQAIKIWTHHSRGTAYTLHDDGTLSLEKPARPKPVYGYD